MNSIGDSTAAGSLCPTQPGPSRQEAGAVPASSGDGDAAAQEEGSPDGAEPSGAADAARVGYRGPSACAAAGVTYRQLDYWARTGLVEPSVRSAVGTGPQRLYGVRDVLMLTIVRRLLDAGISLQNIRIAVRHLRERPDSELPHLTLLSDGATVYECTSSDHVVELLRGGQGVFGIGVGAVWHEVDEVLAQLRGEHPQTGVPVLHDQAVVVDELALRRQRHRAG